MTSFLQKILKENIEIFVNDFTSTSNFETANDYANKLRKTFSLMSFKQKEVVLDTFCDNDRLYYSFNVPTAIKYLFQEDIKHNADIESYWSSFRKKLDDKFPDDFEDLKQLIDS